MNQIELQFKENTTSVALTNIANTIVMLVTVLLEINDLRLYIAMPLKLLHTYIIIINYFSVQQNSSVN